MTAPTRVRLSPLPVVPLRRLSPATLAALDEAAAASARRAFTGVPVTLDSSVRWLRRYGNPSIGLRLLAPAMLLACDGGPYSDPTCDDFYDGWVAAGAMAELPPALAIASPLGARFDGSVAELTAVVTAVLTQTH